MKNIKGISLIFISMLCSVFAHAKIYEYKTEFEHKIIDVNQSLTNCEINVIDTDLDTQDVITTTAHIGQLRMFLQYEDGSHLYEIKPVCEDDEYCRDFKTAKKDLKKSEIFTMCKDAFPLCASEINNTGFGNGQIELNVLEYGNKKQKKTLIKAFNAISKKMNQCKVEPTEYQNSYELEFLNILGAMQVKLQDKSVAFEFINRYVVGNYKQDAICGKTTSGVRFVLTQRRGSDFYFDGAKNGEKLNDEIWNEKCEGLITREQTLINKLKEKITKVNVNYKLTNYQLRGQSDSLDAVCGEVIDQSTQSTIRYYYDFLNGVFFENTDEYFVEQWQRYCI